MVAAEEGVDKESIQGSTKQTPRDYTERAPGWPVIRLTPPHGIRANTFRKQADEGTLLISCLSRFGT